MRIGAVTGLETQALGGCIASSPGGGGEAQHPGGNEAPRKQCRAPWNMDYAKGYSLSLWVAVYDQHPLNPEKHDESNQQCGQKKNRVCHTFPRCH